MGTLAQSSIHLRKHAISVTFRYPTLGTCEIIHLHPSDRFNLDQHYTYPTKRLALENTKRLLEQWLMELEDCP